MADESDLDKYDNVVVTAEDFPIPQGNNNLSSLAMFTQRKYYSEVIYPNEFWAPTPFDLWATRPLFGKVNQKGEPIFAPSTYLKQVENNVWALDFVADAFADFKTEFLFLNKNNPAGTPYELLIPTRGWASGLNLYDNYMDTVYDLFINYLENNKVQNNLLDFSEFMEVFYHFINNTSPNIPITFGQFVMSKHCPPTISGLMIDISTDYHGNDVDKFNHFLNGNNCFICFAETAEKFGFKLDKNFPGRVIADINSPVMNRAGDINKRPSEGGMGYMLRYPKIPHTSKDLYALQPNPPARENIPRPDEMSSNPFEPGDTVAVAVVRGDKPLNLGQSKSGFTYTLLKNHTTLINRQREPGHRPRKYRQKNILDFLKNRVLAARNNGLFLPIYGQVVSLSTSTNFENISQTIFGTTYTPPNEEVAIIDIKNLEGTMGVSPAGIWMGNGEKIWGVEADDDVENILDDGREYRFTTGFWPAHMYVEVPVSALHLKDGAGPYIIKRFGERVNYDTRLQKYIKQKDAADKRYDDQLKDYHDRIMPEWNLNRIENEKEWNFFENPNNKLTVSNLFNRRFGSANLASVELLKQVCMQFYYSYAHVNPNAVVSKVVPSGPNSYKTKNKIIKREVINKKLINEKYPDTYWIKQYILLCNAQSQQKYSLNKLRLIRQRAMEIYQHKGIKDSIAYVQKQMSHMIEIDSMPPTVFKK
jgi:hypothetical protein